MVDFPLRMKMRCTHSMVFKEKEMPIYMLHSEDMDRVHGQNQSILRSSKERKKSIHNSMSIHRFCIAWKELPI